MTKAAIAHLTWCLAVEWGRHGITVNAVAPTFIRTPGTTYALTFGVIEGSHERASQGSSDTNIHAARLGTAHLDRSSPIWVDIYFQPCYSPQRLS
jgi:NAD(P)-dependent dehydrogenase (short-subunit alcohol dehydrogenase family)